MTAAAATELANNKWTVRTAGYSLVIMHFWKRGQILLKKQAIKIIIIKNL
jgi:hypothetical protein